MGPKLDDFPHLRIDAERHFEIVIRQPIDSPYGSLCIRGLRRIRSPPASVTNLTMYLFQTNACTEGVSEQRPHLWAFAAPSFSTMCVCVSVVLFHGGLCFRALEIRFCAKPSYLVTLVI